MSNLTIGGLCLANAKLGAVHGYAAVLGGLFEGASHGAVCAALLPHVFRKNAEKLESMVKNGDPTAKMRLQRFVEVSRIITGIPNATVSQGVTWLEVLVRDLDVPRLSKLCGDFSLSAVAQATSQSSSYKGNPVDLTNHELITILNDAL